MPVTVAELLARNAELIEQCQLEVRQRRVFRIDNVTAALERPGASAHKQSRQRAMCMAVAVAEARAVYKNNVIEHRALAIRRLSQFLKILSEQPDVIPLNMSAL